MSTIWNSKLLTLDENRVLDEGYETDLIVDEDMKMIDDLVLHIKPIKKKYEDDIHLRATQHIKWASGYVSDAIEAVNKANSLVKTYVEKNPFGDIAELDILVKDAVMARDNLKSAKNKLKHSKNIYKAILRDI